MTQVKSMWQDYCLLQEIGPLTLMVSLKALVLASGASRDVTKNFESHCRITVECHWMDPDVAGCDWSLKYHGHVTMLVVICSIRLWQQEG